MLKVIHRCLYNTRVSIFDFAQTALLNYLMVDKTAWTHFVRILTDFPHLLTILMYFDSQSFPRRKITFFKIKTAKGRGGKVQRISLRLDKIYQIPPQGSVIILWHPPSPPPPLIGSQFFTVPPWHSVGDKWFSLRFPWNHMIPKKSHIPLPLAPNDNNDWCLCKR